MPAIELVMMKAPPSGFALKVARSTYQVGLCAHVDGEAGVPVGVRGGGEVGEGAEARVALGMR